MIVKMKFLSITGPKADIDRVTEKYLSKYEIHLENALTELTQARSLTPYFEINPYKESLHLAENYYDMLDSTDKIPEKDLSLEDALNLVKKVDEQISALDRERAELEEENNHVLEHMRIIMPFRGLDYDLTALVKFRYIKLHFGRIEKHYYEKFEKYIYNDEDTMFVQCYADDQYVWGVYFFPKEKMNKADVIYSSMHFERIWIPDEYGGTPEDAYQLLLEHRKTVEEKIALNQKQRAEMLRDQQSDIAGAKRRLDKLSQQFDIRKLAACTRGEADVFYILCGWMTEADARDFAGDVAGDEKLFCIVEDQDHDLIQQPPTKLSNPKFFKPFEMYVKMYGLPSYNEMDPTWFVAITYAFIFGAMFGDVGQGLCLLIGGFLLYHFKKMDLAGIIGTAGIFSTFFGFMFGSLFGFEDLIPALWLRPMEHMSTVPFVGKLNTVFIISIAFGMFIILACIIFHILNGYRDRDAENIWFDANALAGLVFYGAAAAVIVLFVSGHALPGGVVLLVMFLLPLLVIFLKEPLTALVEKKGQILPKEKGMFFVQGFFELFEVLLSYFSNTLSFVRIGAFAVSHAAMMEVVLMLAGAEQGSPNPIVMVLGNVFVIGLEGLVVGIQVLRLEYYEIFSRFYKGTGRAFKPFAYKTVETKK